jgi:hypothetical protein
VNTREAQPVSRRRGISADNSRKALVPMAGFEVITEGLYNACT